MYECKKCSKTFEKRHAFIGHCSSHNRGDSYKKNRSSGIKKVKEKKRKEKSDKIFQCSYCNLIFDSGFKLGGHKISCASNPDYFINNQKKSRVLSEKAKLRKLSDEHKNKISESRKKYLDENPGKIPYLLNHSSKESYPEELFRKALDERKIKGWVQEHPIKRYSLDFAFIDKKIDVEIDGGMHNDEKVSRKDKIRDETLSSMGWEIIRIPASLIRSDIKLAIEMILNKI